MSNLLLDNLSALAARLRSETGLKPKDSVVLAGRLLIDEDDMFKNVEFEDDFAPPATPSPRMRRDTKKISPRSAAPKAPRQKALKHKQTAHKRPRVVAGTAA
jgi:hypothetical protein